LPRRGQSGLDQRNALDIVTSDVQDGGIAGA
jgi:hypothetical protein